METPENGLSEDLFINTSFCSSVRQEESFLSDQTHDRTHYITSESECAPYSRVSVLRAFYNKVLH